MGARICLVGTAAVAHNPRLLKEADALHEAGYGVRVVNTQSVADGPRFDGLLMERRAWRLESLSMVGRGRAARLLFWRSRLRHQLCRRAAALALGAGVAERALTRLAPELRALVARERADLYIAHTVKALPAAAAAAARWGARLGYDAEDLHTAEWPEQGRPPVDQRAVAHVEGRLIGRCDYVSAPSEAIADALAARYGVPRPLVIHNVFPWADRARIDGQLRQRRGGALSLFWFSQAIGLNRGVQDAIRAAGLLAEPVQIHLVGGHGAEVRDALTALARECGVADQLSLYGQVPPEELLSRAAEHDVGLAAELGFAHSASNALTVTNKLFFYLLAGLALAASDTPGQRAVLARSPEVGALYPPGDHQALATILRRWQQDPASLRDARAAALAAARDRWCWERERGALLGRVAALVGPAARPAAAAR